MRLGPGGQSSEPKQHDTSMGATQPEDELTEVTISRNQQRPQFIRPAQDNIVCDTGLILAT